MKIIISKALSANDPYDLDYLRYQIANPRTTPEMDKAFRKKQTIAKLKELR